ncbi:MAG: hypothetical protein R3E90_06035 [Marinicella sp.]
MIDQGSENSAETDKVKFKNYESDFINKDFSKLTVKQKIELLKLQNKKIKDPAEQRHQKATATFKNAKKKEKQLHGDSTNLTDHQVRVILHALIQNNSEASYLLALTLFSGQNIVASSNKIKVDLIDHIEYSFEPNIKQNSIQEGLEQVYLPTNKIIRFPLPDFFEQYQKRDQDNNDIEGLLDIINSQIYRPITINQITNYMSYWMSNEDVDSSIINLVRGTADKLSGTNYYLTSINNICHVYDSYLSHLCQVGDIKLPQQTNMIFGCIGSNVVVKSHFVSRLFQVLSNRLNQTQLNNKEQIKEHHNLFTVYTILLLNLCTGHRPVDHPYMTLDYFDLESDRIFINDKGHKYGDNHRVLVLPQIAVKQINAYLNYLQELSHTYRLIDSELVSTVNQILKGQLPLFHFLHTKLVPIKNRQLTKKLKNIFPVKSNWNRHYMRTTLRGYGVDGQSVDLWMGHEGIGGSGLAQHAAGSMQQLVAVADQIEKITADLKIEMIKGKLNEK